MKVDFQDKKFLIAVTPLYQQQLKSDFEEILMKTPRPPKTALRFLSFRSLVEKTIYCLTLRFGRVVPSPWTCILQSGVAIYLIRLFSRTMRLTILKKSVDGFLY